MTRDEYLTLMQKYRNFPHQHTYALEYLNKTVIVSASNIQEAKNMGYPNKILIRYTRL